VDITLSRTFRKDEYRGAMGHMESSDREYMKLNANTVSAFFDAIEPDRFHAVVTYDDLRRNTPKVLSRLADVLGLSVAAEYLEAVADEFSAERVKEKFPERARNNLYVGEQKPIPEETRRAAADILKAASLKMRTLTL
jgi:hypothetical protein